MAATVVFLALPPLRAAGSLTPPCAGAEEVALDSGAFWCILCLMRSMIISLSVLSLFACDDSNLVTFCALPVEGSPTRGGDDALVTIVEFSDFQCPYCGAAQPALTQAEERFGADLRVVFKHLPLSFHENARPAAIAAICADEQGSFWEMHDLLFANQGALGESDLVGYATELGLDLEAWESCRVSERPAERLDQDQQAAQRARVPATPTFFFNGSPRVGAMGSDELEAEVVSAIDDANSSGIAREDYYETLTGYACE